MVNENVKWPDRSQESGEFSRSLHIARIFTGCSTFTSVTEWLETQGRTARRLCGSSMLPMLPLSWLHF
ncbi:hypothetical protein H5410_050533 [Solanum commersonii]|uniref:Uncharacterized protein n=1 Tax=Solanum commersonii TaxID=4109 RepID=A0A9J5WVT5_SOLCO|nr:hypothetical protein H5410_050533 [Solanum commersonii]